MSWYHKNWHYREAVTIWHAGSGTTVDIQFVVPPDMSRFWNFVASNGADIRVTASDGVTELDYERLSFTHATKTLDIYVDNYGLPQGATAASGKTNVVWLYWGFNDGAGGTASDLNNTALTVSGSQISTTSIAIGSVARSGSPVIVCAPEPTEATTPSPEIALKPSEIITVWWDFRNMLARRDRKENGSLALEEIELVNVLAQNSAGTPADVTSTLINESETRVMHPGFIRTTVTAITGDVSSNYMVTLQVITSNARKLNYHALIKLRTFTAPPA